MKLHSFSWTWNKNQQLLSFTGSAPHACLPCTVTMMIIIMTMMMMVKVCVWRWASQCNATRPNHHTVRRPVAMREVDFNLYSLLQFLHTVGISFVKTWSRLGLLGMEWNKIYYHSDFYYINVEFSWMLCCCCLETVCILVNVSFVFVYVSFCFLCTGGNWFK